MEAIVLVGVVLVLVLGGCYIASRLRAQQQPAAGAPANPAAAAVAAQPGTTGAAGPGQVTVPIAPPQGVIAVTLNERRFQVIIIGMIAALAVAVTAIVCWVVLAPDCKKTPATVPTKCVCEETVGGQATCPCPKKAPQLKAVETVDEESTTVVLTAPRPVSPYAPSADCTTWQTECVVGLAGRIPDPDGSCAKAMQETMRAGLCH